MVSALMKQKARATDGEKPEGNIKRSVESPPVEDEASCTKRLKKGAITDQISDETNDKNEVRQTNGQSTETQQTKLNESGSEDDKAKTLGEVEIRADNKEGNHDDEDSHENPLVLEPDRSPTVTAESDGGNLESGFMSFPEKIRTLLSNDTVKDAMWWLPDGDAFCIQPVPFTEKVLDQHFQGTKFESFTRKLNRWGFKRVAGDGIPANAIAFYHNLFQKDHPELLKDMSGGKSKIPVDHSSKKNGSKAKGGILHNTTAPKSNNVESREMNGNIQRVTNQLSTNENRDHFDFSMFRDRDRSVAVNSLRDAVGRGQVDPSPQLRSLLAQQLGNDVHSLNPLLNESLVREQLHRSRGFNPHDLLSGLSQQRSAEIEQLLSSVDTSRLLGQQRDQFLQNNLATDNTRLLLQQLASSNGASNTGDLAARILAQRAGALDAYGNTYHASALLDQIASHQLNPDTEMALRLLGRGDGLGSGLAGALARQHLNPESLGYSSADLQTRLLVERLRASDTRGHSGDILNRLLNPSAEAPAFESSDLRSRLMSAAGGNPRLAQLLHTDPNLTNQQIMELLLMQQQQREARSRF